MKKWNFNSLLTKKELQFLTMKVKWIDTFPINVKACKDTIKFISKEIIVKLQTKVGIKSDNDKIFSRLVECFIENILAEIIVIKTLTSL